jgi:ribonucleoside-diphosphate reductase alpha chain
MRRRGTTRSNWASSTAIRNAQTTVIAPTGTIGLVMDCDTTGIEPDFALVKFKKLAGGGYFKIINQAVPEALRTLGYARRRSKRSSPMRSATARCADGCPRSTMRDARGQGLHAEISPRREALPSAFDIKFVFNKWTLGEENLRQALGIPTPDERCFDLLEARSASPAPQIEAAANTHVCGAMTVEGAPHLKPEHLPVFDCANKCGRTARAICRPNRISA